MKNYKKFLCVGILALTTLSLEANAGIVIVNSSPANVSSQIANANLARLQNKDTTDKKIIDEKLATLILGGILVGGLLRIRNLDKKEEKEELEEKDKSVKQINQLRKKYSSINDNSYKIKLKWIFISKEVYEY